MASAPLNCDRTVSFILVYQVCGLLYTWMVGQGVVLLKNLETVPLFEEFNFCRDWKIHEGAKQKFPPNGYEMKSKHSPSPKQPVLWAFVREMGRNECLYWDLVSVGIW